MIIQLNNSKYSNDLNFRSKLNKKSHITKFTSENIVIEIQIKLMFRVVKLKIKDL